MSEINLFGVIGEGQLTASVIKSQLALANRDEELVVRIDSPGGSVLAGFAMYKAFAAYDGPKRAIIEPSAFSIASYLAMAFDTVEIADNGYVMIHNPSLASDGDDEDHARDAKLLAELKADMVRAYSQKTGVSETEMLALMKTESYFKATDALKMGFVDRVSDGVVAARSIAAYQNSMPYQVVASLRCDANPGDTNPPTEKPMADSPVAATVADIKAAFPKAKAEFIVGCVEKGLPLASVATAAAEELLAENEALKAKLQAMEEEDELAKAKAMEEEEKAEAEAKAAEEAKAKAKGADPVARATGGAPTAKAKWSEALAAELATTKNRQRALTACNRKNPGLREEMLAEVNA